MKACLINYNFSPDWLKDYDLETIIYDRSDDGIDRQFHADYVYETKNKGDVDWDKLSYLVEHYYDLPDIFVWGKTNIFKYVDEVSFKKALEKKEFAPLLKSDHRTYSDSFGVVCRYSGSIYEERANSWFFNANLNQSGRFNNWSDWCSHFMLPQTEFIPFAPGGNYLLTREKVHRFSRDFYDEMRGTLPYASHPVEAHCCERSYYLLWR